MARLSTLSDAIAFTVLLVGFWSLWLILPGA